MAIQIYDKPTRIPSLKSKEEYWCRMVLSGKSQSEAYRIAYNHPNAASAKSANQGNKIAKRPHIIAFLEQGKRNENIKAYLTRSDRLRILAEIAQNAKCSPRDRIRAIEAYGKLAGDCAPTRDDRSGHVQFPPKFPELSVRERAARLRTMMVYAENLSQRSAAKSPCD